MVLGGATATLAAQMELPAPVGVRVPLPPTPLAAMGHSYLGYELHLDSFAPVDLTLSSLEIFLGDQTAAVASYRGTELASMRLDPTARAAASGLLPAGGFDVLFVWLELPRDARPGSLRHRISLAAGGNALTAESKIAVLPVADAPVLGPPLRGGPWVMAHGPANPNGHRRSYVAVGGRAAVVQREGGPRSARTSHRLAGPLRQHPIAPPPSARG